MDEERSGGTEARGVELTRERWRENSIFIKSKAQYLWSRALEPRISPLINKSDFNARALQKLLLSRHVMMMINCVCDWRI